MLKMLILSLVFVVNCVFAQQTYIRKTPIMIPQYIQLTNTNSAWKTHVWAGNEGQSIMMSISSYNSKDNQSGYETLDMDRFVIVVSGKGNVIIEGQNTMVNTGDMIFIPKGSSHNIVNLSADQPLKLFIITSKFYMPRSTFMTQEDEIKAKQ
jgi:quercetin dioxygenase-like cupin family protein